MRKEGIMGARRRREKSRLPDIGKTLEALYQACHEGDGVLDEKSKELLMLALACLCCRHCTQERIQRALEAHATKDEVAEALLVALYWAERFGERPICADAECVPERSTDAALHDKGHTEGTERSDPQRRECLSQVMGCIA